MGLRLLFAFLFQAPSATALAQETVSEARLRADVERLVGFGMRHTLSVQDHPKRGIGAFKPLN
jgi:hypothetical protein